jgi:DNA-binding NarL/FixJ family response regulator
VSTPVAAAPAAQAHLPGGLRVLLADEHPGVRAGLAALLGSAGLVTPCAEVDDGNDAWTLLQSAAVDLALVDVALRGMNGFELLRRLRALGSNTPVLMLSMHTETGYALQAFEAGANGYIGKDAPAQALVAAAGNVAAGGSHVPAPLADRVHLLPHGRVRVEPHARLSARELRLLRLLSAGVTEADAAQRLRLTPGEAARSRDRVAQKLRLADAADWQRYGKTHGLC